MITSNNNRIVTNTGFGSEKR